MAVSAAPSPPLPEGCFALADDDEVTEALIAGYGNSLYAEPIIFLIILMVLFVRPYGLLGDFEAARR